MSLPDGRCPQCGFDPPTVSPGDAAAAVRSYPRRFRALLVRPDDADPEIVRRRPAPDEPSAAEHAMAAAVDMDRAATALHRVRVHDHPVVDIAAGPQGATQVPPLDTVLERIDAAARALAAGIEAISGDEWRRTGVAAGGEPVGALDIARAGAHAGIHALRAAERALARLR